MKWLFIVLAIAGAVVLLGAATRRSHTPAIKETISVSGAWSIYPLVVKWGDAYQQFHPGVKLDISAGGAGKGMADALSGAVDIGMVSREIDPAEKAKGATPIFIAKDAVFATASAGRQLWWAAGFGVLTGVLVTIFVLRGARW